MHDETPRPYRAIAAYLVRQGGASVVLTYTEIEVMIGEQLPLGAMLNTTWWTSTARLHVRMWREHGWSALPDRAQRTVRFTRDATGP